MRHFLIFFVNVICLITILWLTDLLVEANKTQNGLNEQLRMQD